MQREVSQSSEVVGDLKSRVRIGRVSEDVVLRLQAAGDAHSLGAQADTKLQCFLEASQCGKSASFGKTCHHPVSTAKHVLPGEFWRSAMWIPASTCQNQESRNRTRKVKRIDVFPITYRPLHTLCPQLAEPLDLDISILSPADCGKLEAAIYSICYQTLSLYSQLEVVKNKQLEDPRRNVTTYRRFFR